MLSSLALSGPIAHGWGWGLGWIHPVLTLLWIGLLVTLIVLLVRRGRAARAAGWHGPWGGPWHGGPHAATRSAEATLAERFANGDIDEKEYRARLEVLRANGPTPPAA